MSSKKSRFRLPRFLRREKTTEERQALSLPPMSRGTQFFSFLLFFALGAALTAFLIGNPLGLSGLPGGEGSGPMPAHADKQPVSFFQCPMHPEVVDDHESDCPICGMKLVEVDTGSAPSTSEEVYRCPMHPEVIDDHESDCPICGMKLVAVDDPGATETGGGQIIEIDPEQVQNIGVVSEPARREAIAREIRTVGILDFNAERITWINTKFSGWIEKVHVNYVGQDVTLGQPLFEVYSPELVTTQEEYIRALEYKDSLEGSDRGETRQQAESLLRSARQRLVYWDISEDQIELLERQRSVQRRLTVRSPVDGVVADLMDEALEGLFVEAGKNLYKIADLSSLWVHADVYESDLPWVRENQPAVVSFRHDAARQLDGKILFLYPELSRETRTLKICVEVPNENRRLRAGMYSDVTIRGPSIENAVVVPDSAVLRSGERNLIFVDLGQGKFEAREVEVGIRGGDRQVQIVRGLDAGESVVTQAQFMLDSESRMREAIAKFANRGNGNTNRHAGHAP